MKKITILILILGIAGGAYYLQSHKQSASFNEIRDTNKSGAKRSLPEGDEIRYYTCGMHPSVKVSPQEYEKGTKDCPICYMALVPVCEKGKASKAGAEVISIDAGELALVGIETEEIRVRSLLKEIEAVGVVAYDPGLRTAQEEYLQALNTYKKVSQSQFADAKVRAKELVEASEIKLKLLGFDSDLIKELKKSGQADQSLILPDDFMWVYAHIYEHEASWPKKGDKVKITSQVDPSLIFAGEVKSIEPIVQENTRTIRLKIIVENKNYLLKPNMYVDVYLKSLMREVLSLPKEALLDTGKRKVVYVDLGRGEFALREVKVGPLAQGIIDGQKIDFYPLAQGLNEGEKVVAKGNFLIDSQSRLGAASSAYGGALGQEEKGSTGHQR
jgi:hypothetical protein